MSTRAIGLLLAGLGGLSACNSEGEPEWIREPFKVRAGDDPAWSRPDFDDGGWALAGSRLLPGAAIEGWSGIGWFRLWIDVPAEAAGRPVPLYVRSVGAAEVFIDGARSFSIGDPGAVAAGGRTPVDYRAEYPRWILFSGPGRHLIAVRFASLDLEAMHRVGFPGGFELALAPGDVDPAAEWLSWLVRAAFIGSTLALALLHLLLFLFHRQRPENLHYALATLGAAVVMASQEALRWCTSTTETLVVLGIFGAAISLSSVMLLRFYYAVFLHRIPWGFRVMVAVAVAISLCAWATPRAVYYAFAGLVFLEQARVLITAVVRRADGAWIIGVGGVFWLVGAALQMLGDTGVIAMVPDAYLYGFLALLGSISVYLARDIARAMERYRTIFETTGTGTIIFGDDGVISLANAEWAQLTGYPRPEIEGRMRWTELFADPSLEERSSAARTHEVQLRDRRGKLHDGVVTIATIEGTRDRVGSFLDLTELERAKRQMIRADKMAALGQISAGVAHEINNPNNFIHFNLPILRKYVEAMRRLIEPQLQQNPGLELLNMRYEVFIEDLSKLIDNMEHGSQRITSIVSDLRSYIRSGEETEMKPGSISRVIEQVMALAGKQVRKMVKELRVDVPEDLPLVTMNAGKIEQVLINLLINAGQAADKEASWVAITARADAAGRAVEIVVEDNGTGIPADVLEQIFEPFFTTKGRETGTGLGLAISQQIIEEHRGRIEVTSELGRGSRFTVRLPAAE